MNAYRLLMTMACTLTLPVSAHATPTNAFNATTAAWLFSLVNPTIRLGFANDAIALALPDTPTILHQLSDIQAEDVVRHTLALIDHVYTHVDRQGEQTGDA